MNIKKNIILFFIVLLFSIVQQSNGLAQSIESVSKLTLEQCIDLTLKNNLSRNTFEYSEKIASTKLKQAQSGYYPSVDLTAAYNRIDQDPNFVMPESKIQIPAINLGNFSIPSLTMPIPQQDVKLADKQNIYADLSIVLPLFTGGKITSYVEQAEAGIAIAKNDSRINEDQIIYDTKKLYYSVLLATSLEDIARETYERLATTLSVTESLYQNGSGRVTKTDYLKNKIMVDAVKTMLEQITGEKKSAVIALINAMGLDWQTNFEPADSTIPFSMNNTELVNYMDYMYNNNPLFAKINNAMNVYNSKIDEAKSDYYPSVALIGGYHKFFSGYDYGVVTPQNQNVWMVGLGMKLNIFNGWRTSAFVEENKLEHDKLSNQKEYLKKGLTTKLQYIYEKIKTAELKQASSLEALNSAVENRELIEKAYFNDIMELEDLLQAQLTEAFLKAQYHMTLFEHADFTAQLENLISKSR
jgi:outer membrane protein TolC